MKIDDVRKQKRVIHIDAAKANGSLNLDFVLTINESDFKEVMRYYHAYKERNPDAKFGQWFVEMCLKGCSQQ